MLEPSTLAQAVRFMEDHMSEPLSLSRCAQVAGYSAFHFQRLFKQAVGMTPAVYIRRRRLTQAAVRIANGGAIADAAFSCGFNSKENFLRAFQAEHGVLPSAYRTAGNCLLLLPRACFQPEPRAVASPSLVRLPSFSLTVYPSDAPTPPLFWNRYNCGRRSKRLSGGTDCEDYGVLIPDRLSQACYCIGIPTPTAQGDTTGTLRLPIPGGLYAVFHTPPARPDSFVWIIQQTWAYIERVWLPASGHRHRGTPEFEVYRESSRSFSERIYLPLHDPA